MKIFGQIVRTVVNTALLPVEVVKDVVTLGNVGHDQTHTGKRIEKLMTDADEKP
jgi:hypothetical protein